MRSAGIVAGKKVNSVIVVVPMTAAAASEQFWRANARPLFSARPAAVRALQAEQHRASRVTPCRVYPALFFLSFFPPSSSFLSLSLSSKVNFCR